MQVSGTTALNVGTVMNVTDFQQTGGTLATNVPIAFNIFQILGGTLNLIAPCTTTNLTFGSGTINGPSSLTMSGTTTWSGSGNVLETDLILLSGSVTNFSAGSQLMNGSVTNSGTFNWTGVISTYGTLLHLPIPLQVHSMLLAIILSRISAGLLPLSMPETLSRPLSSGTTTVQPAYTNPERRKVLVPSPLQVR